MGKETYWAGRKRVVGSREGREGALLGVARWLPRNFGVPRVGGRRRSQVKAKWAAVAVFLQLPKEARQQKVIGRSGFLALFATKKKKSLWVLSDSGDSQKEISG